MQNVDDENVVIMNWDPFYKDRRGTSHQISTEGRDTDLVFCVRNANTSSGRHFHEGTHNKDPEVLYLLSGQMEVKWSLENVKENTFSRTVTAPAIVRISNNVWHELVALTHISFLELNSMDDSLEDTHHKTL